MYKEEEFLQDLDTNILLGFRGIISTEFFIYSYLCNSPKNIYFFSISPFCKTGDKENFPEVFTFKIESVMPFGPHVFRACYFRILTLASSQRLAVLFDIYVSLYYLNRLCNFFKLSH